MLKSWSFEWSFLTLKPPYVKLVWIHAAAHCELCETNSTHDFRIGAADENGRSGPHSSQASPKGASSNTGHSEEEGLDTDEWQRRESLCCCARNAITGIDRDGSDNYPKDDLRDLHLSCLTRIRPLFPLPGEERAIPVIVQGQHHQTDQLQFRLNPSYRHVRRRVDGNRASDYW